MADVPKRRAAIAVVLARLAAITKAAGYSCDAGNKIVIGERPVFGPDDETSLLAIVPGDTVEDWQGEHVVYTLPVNVAAVVFVEGEEETAAWLAVEALLADIKRAVELGDDQDPRRNLGGILVAEGLSRGSTRTIARPEGAQYVGAAVEYRMLLTELWGNP